MTLLQARLTAQQIARPAAATPDEVVARLGALQGQDFYGAKWSIGLRLRDTSDADITEAIEARTIVRTWLMRGTLHITTPADVRWILGLVRERLIAGSAGRRRQLGLTDDIFARSRDILVRALEGGRQLTRADVYETLEHGGVSPAGQRGYHLLWRAGLDGVVCFAAHDDKQPTFALLDEWVPPAPQPERDEALAELARRYFTGHGPATVQDFAWWSGLTMAEVRKGLQLAASHLAQETIDGTTYWMDASLRPADMPDAVLLPGFDEYILGYKDRRAALDPQYADRIVPGGNGMFLPTLLIDGRVAGTWKRTVRKSGITIGITPFASLGTRDKRAVAKPAERYGGFMGDRATVTIEE